MNTGSFRGQHNNVGRLISRSDYDVTKLVATEKVQNDYSLLESFMPKYNCTVYFIDRVHLK